MQPGARRIFGMLAGACALAGVCALPARAAVPDAAVKAAYLLKLGPFVTQNGVVVARPVCTLGRDPVVDSLPEVAAGAGVDVRAVEGAQAVGGCGVLYVASGGPRERALQDSRGQPVLVVTDGPGGVIGFVTQANRVRFTIDLRDARARGLEISSKLLSLAVSLRR